jgi:hypothetical protein
MAKRKRPVKSDDQRIQEMIDAGQIIEAQGNLWDLPAPTFKLRGKSASQQLIEERESYQVRSPDTKL